MRKPSDSRLAQESRYRISSVLEVSVISVRGGPRGSLYDDLACRSAFQFLLFGTGNRPFPITRFTAPHEHNGAMHDVRLGHHGANGRAMGTRLGNAEPDGAIRQDE